MDIKKIVYMLGASLPVAVVGGVIALNKAVDPPMHLLDRLGIYELPEKEQRRIYKAYSLCHDLADLILRPAIRLYGLSDPNLRDARWLLLHEAESVLRGFESGVKSAIWWAAEDLGVPKDKLEKVFSYGVYSDVIYMARAIKDKIERGESQFEVHDSAKFRLEDILKSVKNAFVECLIELDVLKVPLRSIGQQTQ